MQNVGLPQYYNLIDLKFVFMENLDIISVLYLKWWSSHDELHAGLIITSESFYY